MDFSDIEGRWKEHSEDLEEQLIFNARAVRRDKLQQSEKELFLPLLHEIVNVLVITATVIVVAIFSLIHLEELRYSIPGLVGTGIGSVYVYYAAAKAIRMGKVDYYNPSIVVIQKNIASIKLLVLKYRKLELALLPIFILLISPILFKVIQKRDLYADLQFYLFEVLFVAGFGILGIYLANKYLYDQRIKKVLLFVEEIKEFES